MQCGELTNRDVKGQLESSSIVSICSVSAGNHEGSHLFRLERRTLLGGN
jgi:hypothetical protein